MPVRSRELQLRGQKMILISLFESVASLPSWLELGSAHMEL